MVFRHVTKDISAYWHGELSSERSKEFAEHIISCSRCRAKYEEVKLGIKLAEQLPKLSAPDRLWPEIEAALGNQTEDPTPRSLRSTWFAWPKLAAASVALFIISLAASWAYHSPDAVIPPVALRERPSWLVSRLSGTPRIGTEEISNRGQLAVGEWLETDKDSRAHIRVESIGNVEIDENTSVRLLASKPDEYRLELARGKMSARIWAPPRLFFVDTPSAVAADMGCAYTLEVDDYGSSLLRVTSGWVELQREDRLSIVPAGAACETRPGVGPSTPYFEDASTVFRNNLKLIDFNGHGYLPGRSAVLTALLNHARKKDTLTLWHLLPRVKAEERVRVYNKIAEYFPQDNDFRDAILNLDQKMLAGWRYEMEPFWISSAKLGSKGDKIDYRKLNQGLSPRMKQMMPK